jgi:hypothetical protein
VRAPARDESLGSRLGRIEQQLAGLVRDVEAVRAAVAGTPDPMPSAQERLRVGGPDA